jgi:hypothetical protein
VAILFVPRNESTNNSPRDFLSTKAWVLLLEA